MQALGNMFHCRRTWSSFPHTFSALLSSDICGTMDLSLKRSLRPCYILQDLPDLHSHLNLALSKRGLQFPVEGHPWNHKTAKSPDLVALKHSQRHFNHQGTQTGPHINLDTYCPDSFAVPSGPSRAMSSERAQNQRAEACCGGFQAIAMFYEASLLIKLDGNWPNGWTDRLRMSLRPTIPASWVF